MSRSENPRQAQKTQYALSTIGLATRRAVQRWQVPFGMALGQIDIRGTDAEDYKHLLLRAGDDVGTTAKTIVLK